MRLNAISRPLARALAGLAWASLALPALAQVPADTPVARLGELSIGQAEVQRLLQGLPEAERAQVQARREGLEAWLRQRLASEALLREAQRQNWADRPEVRARTEAAVAELTARIVSSSYLDSLTQLPAAYPSEAEVAAAYEQAKPSLGLPATYRLAQIYLAAPAGADAAALKALGADAQRLAAQARQGDFAALARSRSQDTASAARGGEVGVLALAQMLPEMRDTVARLKAGEVSEPVASATGWHVLKLLESQPARTATLAEVTPRLRQALREQRRQALARERMAQFAPAERIQIDNAALDAVLQGR